MWLKDSVKFINTYRVDLASSEGQKFMAKQCAIYFGFEQGEAAQTAFVPAGSARRQGIDPARASARRERGCGWDEADET